MVEFGHEFVSRDKRRLQTPVSMGGHSGNERCMAKGGQHIWDGSQAHGSCQYWHGKFNDIPFWFLIFFFFCLPSGFSQHRYSSCWLR